jgi:NADPH-dependent 2,4-dienoyl-CoA reductase/sulfur reductase-like enzyme
MQAKYVLVGNSAASLAAIDWIRKHDRDGSILLLNREKGVAYSRVALPYFVSGERTLQSILIRQKPDYERLGVKLAEEAEVASVDPGAHQVVLKDGRKVGYEKLLLGTGSEVIVPPIQGLGSVPHHYLWTLADAVGMKQATASAKRGLVIGGGFIGMLASEALRKLETKLTIVEMASQLMPQLLDPEGGKIFEKAVRGAGVDLRLGSQVDSVAKKGSAVTVKLKGGGELETDLLVVAAGVRPCLSAVGNGAVKKNRGIVVDEHLRTSAADVWAAGDVAEVRDFVSGEPVLHAIWPTAVDQGRAAGANMAGRPLAYPGSLGMNVVELFDVTLAELGRFREAKGDSIEVSGSGDGTRYRKVVVDPKGVMVGGMYLGDENGVAEMGVIHHAIKRREVWKDFVADGMRPSASYASMFARVPQALPRLKKA